MGHVLFKFRWFAAKGTEMTIRFLSFSFSSPVLKYPLAFWCAKKSIILHLQWQEDSDQQDLEQDQVKSLTSPRNVITQSPISMISSQAQAPLAVAGGSQLSRMRTMMMSHLVALRIRFCNVGSRWHLLGFLYLP